MPPSYADLELNYLLCLDHRKPLFKRQNYGFLMVCTAVSSLRRMKMRRRENREIPHKKWNLFRLLLNSKVPYRLDMDDKSCLNVCSKGPTHSGRGTSLIHDD